MIRTLITSSRFLMALCVLAVACGGYWLVVSLRAPLPPKNSLVLASVDEPKEENAPLSETNDTPPQQPSLEDQSATNISVDSSLVVPRSEATPVTRDLVTKLSMLNGAGEMLTEESAAKWKENFQGLVQQGDAGLAAIRDFLEKDMDVNFGPAGWRLLGYTSARSAMFDALAQIGGPEALTLTLESLRATGVPREIALLARNLEKLAPGEAAYHGDALHAARQTLEMASKGKLDNYDVAPLFEVLHRYGGAEVVYELEQGGAKQWNHYAVIALGQLPDGAGIPSLARMARESGGFNSLQMLAQLAPDHPEARAALLEQARSSNIPANAWAYLQPVLGGQNFHFAESVFDDAAIAASRSGVQAVHITRGNQNYYLATDSGLTAEQLNERKKLLEELSSVTRDPAAMEALQNARTTLATAGEIFASNQKQ